MVVQDDVFLSGEGDRWFARNGHKLQEPADPERDVPLRLLSLYGIHPASVLEVGAANGFRLAALAAAGSTRVVAVDPAEAALADGRARFSKVEFHRGDATAIPLDESFDLVIVNFVLHWVGRERLFAAFAELDRRVRDGGYLLIGDFHGVPPSRTKYHHLSDDVWTYKQDYAEVFLAAGTYERVATVTGAYERLDPAVPVGDRYATSLLRKSLSGLYVASRLDETASKTPA